MRLENFRIEQSDSLTKAVATLIWEDNDRPPTDVYFGTTEAFSQDLSCNPNAFLVGCAIPALRFGEKRIHIDAATCPELQAGLKIATGWLHHWFNMRRDPIRIEGDTQTTAPDIPVARSGFFFSGGIDSLFILRENRLNFSLEHPGSMKDGILVYGLEVDSPKAFEPVLISLKDLAYEANINLIPIYTNIYSHIKDLDPDWKFWVYEYQGAALASVAHILRKRLTRVSIASSFDIPNVYPHGSHPLLDPWYSSYDLRIKYDDLTYSRLQKTKLLADWDIALKHLRVCNRSDRYKSTTLNCGQCEKCLRTRLALLALNALDKASAFPNSVPLSKELLIKQAYVTNQSTVAYYKELIHPLMSIGRDDLVHGIETIINRYYEKDFKGIIKRIDRSLLGGRLFAWQKNRRLTHQSIK